jgi:hypothetical protein
VWDKTANAWAVPGYSPTVANGFSEFYIRVTTPQTGFAGGSHSIRPINLEINHLGTDSDSPYENVTMGIASSLWYGNGSVSAKGTGHNFSARYQVTKSSDALSEHANYFGYHQNNASATPGRVWFTDFNIHSAVGVQHDAFSGIHMFTNNYYNGSVAHSNAKSGAIWAVTQAATGGGASAAHLAATTYPMDVGIGIVGYSGSPDHVSSITNGFNIGLQVGGVGSNWGVDQSKIGTGIDVSSWVSYGIRVSGKFSGATGPAISIADTVGGMVIGENSITGSTALFQINQKTAGTYDPIMRIGSPTAAFGGSFQMESTNGTVKYFLVASAGNFLTGTAAGDAGIRHNTSGKAFHIGGTAKIITVTNDDKLGFFAATPIVKPTVSGSRGANAALASLCTQLAALGLITDSTS